jgi:hypothetical protein
MDVDKQYQQIVVDVLGIQHVLTTNVFLAGTFNHHQVTIILKTFFVTYSYESKKTS